MAKMYWDQTNIPQVVSDQILSDIYGKLGNEYVPYNKFMSKTLTKIIKREQTPKTYILTL